MTNPKNSPMPRRRSGRAAVVAGATLVLALSAGPGAHADDAGLLDGITQVAGQATEPIVQPVVQPVVQPIVQPVVESVQGAVPQPVQEAAEPVVEQVAEPVRQVAEVVEQVTHSSEEPAGTPAREPAGGQAGQSGDDPAETPAQGTVGHGAPGSAGAAGADAAESAVAQHAPGGPSDGHAGDGPGHVDAPAPVAISCPDLPPRAATSLVALHSGDHEAPSDQWTVWDVTNALMHMSAVGDWGSPGEVVSPGQGGTDRRASDLPRQVPAAVPALDIPRRGLTLGPVEMVGLLGLLGLLGVLAAGVAGARARERG